MLLLIASFVFFAGMCSAQSAASSLLIFNAFTSPAVNPVCDTAHFFQTEMFYPVKGSLIPVWCTQTPTSAYNYLFFLNANNSILVKQFGINDNQCSGRVYGQQYVNVNTCVHILGDNPAVSYKVSVQNTNCGSCNGGQGTCCWSPNGNSCAEASNACCCPDFQNACASGSECFCVGECPGASCECQACIPAGEGGTCTNQA